MKKFYGPLVAAAAILLLSACSVRSDAADLYKQEAPLQILMDVPEEIVPGETAMLEAKLMQNGESVKEANFVHFEILKQDGSIPYPMKEAQEVGEGVYQMEVNFRSDGLYFLEVHAGSGDAISNPHYQFIVGELSDSELESLKEGPGPDAGSSGHHH
ncbi:FixH family protein [Planococcus sp. CP5-4]|uniref:FixH family protein n=1 Tax=unclassified Planococcus (in: firmicutes) TaxID=2662419 RepID=UPI001C21B25E|nr:MULTISPECIES: FixH family protein [unclassified Planococcus (in: firmicutes)]MBU9674455.1 FixH family protein [Planococcus sp. CP5-4_YE]MBV0910086.1 FixH family protein [Planococcus sp. CP5-4_UN]MBW6064706.1 FixH family protein [Planococcus sp. CP5-4]